MAKKFVNLIFKGNQKIQYWFIKVQEQQPVFYKRLFLKFSQNSQENTCARVSFLIKLQAWPFLTEHRIGCFQLHLPGLYIISIQLLKSIPKDGFVYLKAQILDIYSSSQLTTRNILKLSIKVQKYATYITLQPLKTSKLTLFFIKSNQKI